MDYIVRSAVPIRDEIVCRHFTMLDAASETQAVEAVRQTEPREATVSLVGIVHDYGLSRPTEYFEPRAPRA